MKRFLLLLSILAFFIVSCKKEEGGVNSQKGKRAETQIETDRYAVPLGDSIYTGPKNAPITIINFSDFQCPFSQRSVPVIAQLMEKHPGKIKYVFKHFPLGFHKMASKAASASIAAQKQGEFWEMYRKIFNDNKNLTQEKLNQRATELKLDMGKYKSDSESQTTQDVIAQDIALGHTFGVRGTPTIFINGKRVVGANLARIKKIIDEDFLKVETMKKEGVTDYYATFIKDGMTHFVRPKSAAPPVNKRVYRVLPPTGIPSVGMSSSALRVVTFLDYQCPHSRKVYNTLKELAKQAKGDILLQFVNLPLSYHSHARKAALASIVAQKHSKFTAYSDKMFAAHHVWSAMNSADFDNYLLAIAKGLGIDEALFSKEIAFRLTKQQLTREMQSAKDLGVRMTPATFINGRYIRGAYPLFSFVETYNEEKERATQLLDDSLSGEKKYIELVKDGLLYIDSAAAKMKKDIFADGGTIYTPSLHGDEPRIGKKSAPLSIVLFIDYPCPYSRRAFMALKQIESDEDYNISIVLKYLPLQSSPHAHKIAKYSIAIQTLYGDEMWLKVALSLFAKQQEIRRLKDAMPLLEKLTTEHGFDWKKVSEKMGASETALILTKDVDEAQRLHVTGVPTFFINGKKIKGVQPISWVREAITERSKEITRQTPGDSNEK
ncbi:thioredoxin domain-containing protein [bacterium]|nr:thioredoxin domain-containing protein [bacterium]